MGTQTSEYVGNREVGQNVEGELGVEVDMGCGEHGVWRKDVVQGITVDLE